VETVACQSRGQAELVVRLATLGLTGPVKIPSGLQASLRLLDRLNARLAKALARLGELADSRTGDQRTRDDIIQAVGQWFVLGRPHIAHLQSTSAAAPRSPE
jgi:hypothetical protein